MKIRHLHITCLFFLAWAGACAQSDSVPKTSILTVSKIFKIMRGEWLAQPDTNFNLLILGDTAVETHYKESKSYQVTVKHETCDPEVDDKLGKRTSTGYYIDESGAYDGVEFCNAILSITDSTMVWFSVDGKVAFKKKK